MSDSVTKPNENGVDEVPDPVASPRERWVGDIVLLAKVVFGTFAFFGIVGIFTGFTINQIAGFYQTVLFYAAVYALITLALNLQWGYTGLFNIGVAGFMAVGAYTMAILTASPDGSPAGFGLPMIVGVIGGVIAAGLVGLVAALPALRVRADYFAIVTLGLSEIIRLMLLSGSLRSFEFAGREMGTGGGSGISSPPADVLANYVLWVAGDRGGLRTPVGEFLFQLGDVVGVQPSIIRNGVYAVILMLFVLGVYVLLTRIAFSPFGRLLKAIREDELVAKSLGKNTDAAKIKVFVLGCALMGLGGILWQGSRTHISPDNFMPIVTFYVFVALIIGGSGSNTGSVLGGFAFAAFLWEGPRFFRTMINQNVNLRSPRTIYDAGIELLALDPLPLLGYLFGSLDEIRFIFIGVVLIVLMIRRPDGLLGHRKELSVATDIDRRNTATDGGRPQPPEWATVRGDSDE